MNARMNRNDARIGVAGRILAAAALVLWVTASAQTLDWLETLAAILGFACLALMVWITTRHSHAYRGGRGGASLLLAWIITALVLGFLLFTWVADGQSRGQTWEGESLSGLVHILTTPLVYAIPTWLASSALLADVRGRKASGGLASAH